VARSYRQGAGLVVPVGFVPSLETPLDAMRLTAQPWAHPGGFTDDHQSTIKIRPPFGGLIFMAVPVGAVGRPSLLQHSLDSAASQIPPANTRQ
jgi:hypothetical protein